MIHENTLFSKIAENSVFRLYAVLGHCQDAVKKKEGFTGCGEPLFFGYTARG